MRNRLTSLLFSLCLAAVFVPAIAAPTGMPLGLKEMWDAGDKAYSEKNYKQAAEWFDKASKYSDFAAQPKDRRAELYRSYGRALVGSEQFAKAIEPLNRSIDLIDQLEGDQRVKSGLNSEAYGLLSGAYAGQKMYREAAEYSLKELNAHKERFPEHKGNGLLEAKIGGWYFRAGMKDKARTWLTEGEKLLKEDLASASPASPDLEKEVLAGAQKMLAECN